MPLADRILIQLLAKRDAAFIPVRIFLRDNLNANAYAARERYRTLGVAWESGEKSEQRRKAAQRALEDATAAELIVTVRGDRVTTGIRLTDRGEHRAASLCWQFTLADGVPIYEAIARRKAKGIDDVWEDHLLPSLPTWAEEHAQDRQYRLGLVQDLMLPWIVRGYVLAYGTMQGNVRYAVGTELPAGFDPGEPADLDVGSGEGRGLYVAAFDAERNRLKKDEPESGEIGPIPASTSAASQEQLEQWHLSEAMATTRGE